MKEKLSSMSKGEVFGSILLLILGAVLMTFTGMRGIHFFELTLPADKKEFAYLAVAATEAGALFWLTYLLFAAKGAYQRGTSWFMIMFDLLGVGLTFAADTFIGAEAAQLIGAIDQNTMILIIAFAVLVVLGNVYAIYACHMASPSQIKKSKQEDINDKIDSAVYAEMDERVPQLAARIAEVKAEAHVLKQEADLLADLAPELRTVYYQRKAESEAQQEEVVNQRAEELRKPTQKPLRKPVRTTRQASPKPGTPSDTESRAWHSVAGDYTVVPEDDTVAEPEANTPMPSDEERAQLRDILVRLGFITQERAEELSKIKTQQDNTQEVPK